jgi:UDPglucose 6-dehydrogenase
LAPVGAAAELAWNPEFLREGFAIEDTVRPDRLVIGVRSQLAEDILRKVYASILELGVPFMVTDFATAELVKVAANSFLATKISFINAMADVCAAAGADVTQLADAIGYDDRIGRKFLNAGLGFGGGCLPKDIRAFMSRAGELGVGQSLLFLREVDEINQRRRQQAVGLARELVGGNLFGLTVTCLGAAFKPNSDDIRDSPALDVAAAIQLQGAHVKVYDPKANGNARTAYPTLDMQDSLLDAAAGADIVLLLTEWQEFRDMTPADLDGLVRGHRILDARNVLDPVVWRSAGWDFRALGRP